MDLAAACGSARKLLWGPRDGDGLSGVESADTERRAGSPLAVEAMTGDHKPGGCRKRERQGTATASGIRHRKSSNCHPASKACRAGIRHVKVSKGIPPVRILTKVRDHGASEA